MENRSEFEKELDEHTIHRREPNNFQWGHIFIILKNQLSYILRKLILLSFVM